MGLQHGGIEGGRAKANYRSLMNYIGQNNLPSFSSGASYSVDPRALNELASIVPFSAGADYMEWFKDYAGFPVDTTNRRVDWNRDRSFTSGTTRGRLLGLTTSHDGTKPSLLSTQVAAEAIDNEDKIQVSSSHYPCSTPAVVRYEVGTQNRAYIIWPICGNWNIREIHMDYDDECPVTYNWTAPCGGSHWSAPTSGGTGRVGTTVAAEVTNSAPHTAPFIYVASIDPTTSNLRILRGIPEPSTGDLKLNHFSVQHTFSGPIDREPDIRVHGDYLYAVWHRADDGDYLWGSRMSLTTDVWETPARLRVSSSGAYVTSKVPPRLDEAANSGLLYLLRTDSSDRLRFNYRSGSYWPASGTFSLPGGTDSRIKTTRRPGLAWLPDNFSNPTGPGHWFIAMATSSNSRLVDLRVRPGATNKFDYGYLRGHSLRNDSGVSLWYRPGSDDANPLMVIAPTELKPPYGVPGLSFFGYPDGVVPKLFHDNNDHASFEEGVCKWIRGPSYDCDISAGLAMQMQLEREAILDGAVPDSAAELTSCSIDDHPAEQVIDRSAESAQLDNCVDCEGW